MGIIPWNKGKTDIYLKETLKKMSLAKLGKKYPKLSAIKKIQNSGKGNPNYGKRGKEASGWKGDDCITPLHSHIRELWKYNEWIIDVFKRDNYVCQDCGKRSGDKQAHHKKLFSLFLKENNIQNIEEAINCKELWDIDNGITLCLKCHKKRHSKSYLVDKEKQANSAKAEIANAELNGENLNV